MCIFSIILVTHRIISDFNLPIHVGHNPLIADISMIKGDEIKMHKLLNQKFESIQYTSEQNMMIADIIIDFPHGPIVFREIYKRSIHDSVNGICKEELMNENKLSKHAVTGVLNLLWGSGLILHYKRGKETIYETTSRAPNVLKIIIDRMKNKK